MQPLEGVLDFGRTGVPGAFPGSVFPPAGGAVMGRIQDRPPQAARRRRLRGARGALALAALGGLGVSAPARADLSDQIAGSIQTILNGMNGNEIDLSYPSLVCLAPNPAPPPACLDSIEVTVQVTGFAFCAPADPWADPLPSPPPGVTRFGCANAGSAGAALGGLAAGAGFDAPDLYVRFRTTRAHHGGCPGEPASGEVAGDGYLHAAASISGEFQVLTVSGCTRLAPVSQSFTVTVEPDLLEVRDDTCLVTALEEDPGARAAFLAGASEQLQQSLQVLFLTYMDDINDMLCSLTPASPQTWGRVKSRYGSGR